MEVLIPAERIQARVSEMAEEIAACLRGKTSHRCRHSHWLPHLHRRFDSIASILPLRVAFITASSYRGGATVSGKLEIRDELLPDIAGRHVLLLDDILDDRKDTDAWWRALIDRGAESVKVAVLLRKNRSAGSAVRAGLCWLHDSG